MNEIIKVVCDDWDEYELLDSGNRKKLERFGDRIILRSEPRAWWGPTLREEWEQAVVIYQPEHQTDDKGRWIYKGPISDSWHLHFDSLTLLVQFTPMSRHIGVFPEHSQHWRWIRECIQRSGRSVNLLSLFGYTGAATLAAATAGASVTHVDASRLSIEWARKNQELSNLGAAPIRWILDDAIRFVKREARRNKRYDALILDPPAFGRGSKGQVWKLERDLPILLAECRELLSDDPLFVLLTMYSMDVSSLLIGNLLSDLMQDFKGSIEVGELALKPKRFERRLPMSIFGQWLK